jgi:hypothetical protein
VRSTKSECERLYPWILKLDLEGAILNRSRLPDELVQALPGDGPGTFRVNVDPVILPRCFPIEQNAEVHRLTHSRRAEHHQPYSAGNATGGSEEAAKFKRA